MSILLERTKQTQATALADPPVVAERAGIVAWEVAEGGKVDGWFTRLGEIRSTFGAEMFACEHYGTLIYAIKDGTQVKAGEVLGYVKPVPTKAPQTSQKPLQVSSHRGVEEVLAASGDPQQAHHQTDPTPDHPTNEALLSTSNGATWHQSAPPGTTLPQIPEEPQSTPVVTTAHNGRRSTMGQEATLPEVEELHLVGSSNTAPTVKDRAPTNGRSKGKERERVKLRGYHVLPSQEKAVKREVARLGLDEDLTCNESELVRCALDLLFSLPPAARQATVDAYKSKERGAGVGAGWPRPGRPKSKSKGA